jgi:hypothetical protein
MIGVAVPKPLKQRKTPPILSSTSPQIRLGAVLAVAAVVGFVAWLVLKDGDDSDENGQITGPEEVSVAELRDVAQSSGTPVYWAGEVEGQKLELTKTESARVFIRYLPEDVDIGERQTFLTVATYPLQNGYAAVRAAARRQGARSTRIEGGGLLVGSKGGSQSVHFSFPGAGYQVEVFHPQRGAAQRLVLDGEVQPVR